METALAAANKPAMARSWGNRAEALNKVIFSESRPPAVEAEAVSDSPAAEEAGRACLIEASTSSLANDLPLIIARKAGQPDWPLKLAG